MVDNAGAYTAYVRQADFCGADQKDFMIYLIPTFFTPNGDGYNETWTIRGIINYPKAHVAIFDRFGKLLCEISKHNLNWNGTYNGHPLPSSDYWFVFKLDDTSPEIRGHFSLIR
ncbi:T9SS type B sorting domain-containing protein [Flavobacterium sp. 3HN19-14]|uniref:T9SS type B sorting domain-containing protein n=1 Tax=Flavobacterium sp. 3HN19-14 TaxID=3448133 RepID=UPI003EDEE5B8